MLFEIKKSGLVGGPVVLAIYMCPFCYTFWCFLYTVFKRSANIFTANILLVCYIACYYPLYDVEETDINVLVVGTACTGKLHIAFGSVLSH